MTWKELLGNNKAQKHSTNKQEIEQLWQVVERGLTDAAVTNISTDLRFQAVYNSALQLATIAVYCAGYRVKGREHHKTTFEALTLAVGQSAANRATYFDTCRKKRNTAAYDHAGQISETEVDDFIKQVTAFKQELDTWIKNNHPQLDPT